MESAKQMPLLKLASRLWKNAKENLKQNSPKSVKELYKQNNKSINFKIMLFTMTMKLT
jgi:hypothetical protein